MAGKKGEKTISLAAVLDLNEASALRGKLMGLRGGNVVVDASGNGYVCDPKQGRLLVFPGGAR